MSRFIRGSIGIACLLALLTAFDYIGALILPPPPPSPQSETVRLAQAYWDNPGQAQAEAVCADMRRTHPDADPTACPHYLTILLQRPRPQ